MPAITISGIEDSPHCAATTALLDPAPPARPPVSSRTPAWSSTFAKREWDFPDEPRMLVHAVSIAGRNI
jgi:hypothetical protein